jgi:hypothetical protein
MTTSRWSSASTINEEREAETETLATISTPKLAPCPDCSHACSYLALSCPSCGRVLRESKQIVIVEREGWRSTIAWGIILAAVIPWFIGIVAFFLLVALGIIGSPFGR